MEARAHSLGGSALDTFKRWMGFPDAEVDEDDDFSWGLIDQSEAPLAEELINRYADRVGYSPIQEDGDVGIEDARRAMRAYRWVLEHLMADGDRARTIRRQMDAEISEAGLGRWFADNGPAVLNVLMDADERIESGEIDPGPRAPLGLDMRTAMIAGAGVVGLAFVWRAIQ